MVIRSVRRGIRKWMAKGPRRRGKGPKIFEIFFLQKSVDRPRFTANWTFDPVVKPFGTTLKKKVRNEVETSD